MKLHEYQAVQLFQKFQIPAPKGILVTQAADAKNAFKTLANPSCMLKVQVLMGGRGKAGGIKKAGTAEEAESLCRQWLGKPFSTNQSAGENKIIKSVWVTELVNLKKEFYLGITVDRSKNGLALLFSTQGGVDVEEVAGKTPEAIEKIFFMPQNHPSKEELLAKLRNRVPEDHVLEQIAGIAQKLCRLFVEKDASLCEINPLAVDVNGSVLALDAKAVFDDNALFRHGDIQVLKDPDEEDGRERKAKEFGLSYVSMNGDIGCLVNGAGLAMATMDVIKLAGGEPANFLDVGGGANADQVKEGFKIILQDERIKAILINIFGGIMKCDVIAEGILQASKEIQLKVPLIVRLEGTRVLEGRELLKRSQLQIISCNSIREAATTAVSEAKKSKTSHAYSR
jgi:succinyl-CoA synthetase beta subunit